MSLLARKWPIDIGLVLGERHVDDDVTTLTWNKLAVASLL